MILNQLKSHNIGSDEFQKYLREHAIQYGWINDRYISHHQVKHKADTVFQLI